MLNAQIQRINKTGTYNVQIYSKGTGISLVFSMSIFLLFEMLTGIQIRIQFITNNFVARTFIHISIREIKQYPFNLAKKMRMIANKNPAQLSRNMTLKWTRTT